MKNGIIIFNLLAAEICLLFVAIFHKENLFFAGAYFGLMVVIMLKSIIYASKKHYN